MNSEKEMPKQEERKRAEKIKAEEYLDQIKKIDAMMKNKVREHARWIKVADGLGAVSLGERIQASSNLHRGADAIGNYVDLEREITVLKQKRQAIINTIEQLPFTEYDVIFKLYVEEFSMKEVAFVKKKSYDWVKRKKSNGLDLLQAVLDRETAQISTEMP